MKKRVLAWIAAITLAITSVTPMLSFAADTDDNLTVSVDITKLATTSDPVPAETLKAHAVKSNYQIGNQGDTPTLYTISGYTPSYITYKLTAEKGKLFSGGSLTIVGKICDYASNENLFLLPTQNRMVPISLMKANLQLISKMRQRIRCQPPVSTLMSISLI